MLDLDVLQSLIGGSNNHHGVVFSLPSADRRRIAMIGDQIILMTASYAGRTADHVYLNSHHPWSRSKIGERTTLQDFSAPREDLY